jgi:hypothetical protein
MSNTVGVIDEKTGKIKPSVMSRTASVTALAAGQPMTSSLAASAFAAHTQPANNAPVSEL